MINILKLIKNKKNEETKETEKTIPIIEVEEESQYECLNLPAIGEFQSVAAQYEQIMLFYDSGIQQIRTKLEILNKEFKVCNDRNPIEAIHSRIKSLDSITNKMKKKGIPLTINSMMNNLYDIAGVRVVCPFIADVYKVANILVNQEDVQLINIKDYIKDPKENGYRSLHMILMVDVYFSDHKSQVPVELQFRTIAMNFWASTEHQLRYKKDRKFTDDMKKELLECSRIMAEADKRMQSLADQFADI